jgi:long-chain acyl-CoA synthetase
MKFITDHGKTAIIYKDKDYSYGDLIRGAKYYSSLMNVDKGDRIIVFTENRPEFMYSFFAGWDAKVIPVNLDAGYDVDSLLYVLNDVEPKYIFTSEKNYTVAQEAREKYGKEIEIIKFEEHPIPEEFKVEEKFILTPEKDDTAVILYTSGTTGEPKGVMLSTDNLLSNVEAMGEIKLVLTEDRMLALLPYHHVLPLQINMLVPFSVGATIAILDELSSDAIKGALQKHKITILLGVPRIWEQFHKGIMNQINKSVVASNLFKLCEKVGNLNFSKSVFGKVHEAFGGHLRLLGSGGAKLEAQITKDFFTLGFRLLEGYGLTETAPVITFNRPNQERAGTVGTVIPGVTVRLGEDGEVLVKGRNVMKGYYNKPEATAEMIDKEGWFHTGDLGQLDNGYLTIIGRKKEMIVLSNGKNINPSDIEEELMKTTDLIKEIAIVDHNNHLLALVYPDFDKVEAKKIVNIKETLKWEIIDKYNVTAPKYRKILEIQIVKEELPKTKLGKLRRFMLKSLIKDEQEEIKTSTEAKKKETINKIDSKEMESKEFKAIAEFIKKMHDVEVQPDSHMEIDLGLDSLDLVEIISFVESNFNVQLTEEDLSRIKTVEALCEVIRERGGNFNGEEINWKQIFDQPVKYEKPTSTVTTRSINYLLKPMFKYYFNLKIEGKENIPKVPVIYAGNHQSFIDAFTVAQVFNSEETKNICYLATAEHFQGKTSKWLAQNGNIVLVDINKNIKEALQVSAQILKEGKSLVIFPEGARTRDGEMQEFKKSFAILAKELNIPVVPFGLKGAYEAMPFGCTIPKRSNVEIKFFSPIYPENLTLEEIVDKTKGTIRAWVEK